MKASMYEQGTCNLGIVLHFFSSGQNVYDLRIDSLLGGFPALQLGGHLNISDDDLTINLVSYSGDIIPGIYELNVGVLSAWMTYKPTGDSGPEYVSLDQGTIHLDTIEFDADNKVLKSHLKFNSVLVYHDNDSICITGFHSIK